MTNPKSKTIFIEYSSHEQGQHFITVMQPVDGQRRIIGRIYKDYDKEAKKMKYEARDWQGTQIFTDTPDLLTLKKRFIESGNQLAIGIPKNPKQEKEKEEVQLEREDDLKELRGRNAEKEIDKGIER